MNSNTNFIVFIVLSAALLLGFQYFYVKPIEQQQHMAQQQEAQPQQAEPSSPAAQTLPRPAATPTPLRNRSDVIKESARLPVVTPELKGTINLKGARFDDMLLSSYHETVDPASPPVTLLSPSGSAPPLNAYYTEIGWLSEQSDAPMPTSDTEWTTNDKQLSPEHPVRLVWNNGKGLVFERRISVDAHYMFTVTDHVANQGKAQLVLYPFGAVARRGNPSVSTSTVLHEGPVGVLGGTLEEITYKKLMDRGRFSYDSVGGWLGITDKYWLVALLPAKDEKITASFLYNQAEQTDSAQGHFQVDYRGAGMTLSPGGSIEHVMRVFAGAKRFELLNDYSDKLDVPLFNRAIDFGWFWFLTIPFMHLLSYLGHTLGSYGLAILVFTVMLKLITLPLSVKSFQSAGRMKQLQPEIGRLKERFADDKVRQNQEMMELFKREKVNPMSGCVPTLIQIPIFFALYKTLYVGIELRQAPFYGWIKDMSLPDPTSALTLFGLVPIDLPTSLQIGAWPILMGLAMMLQQKLSPQPMADKTQARMFALMPIIFSYMLAKMPAGLVIYWTWSNLLSIAQQWYIMRADAKRRGLPAANNNG